MDINTFISQYSNAKDKEVFCKKHIKRQYVPFVEKIAEATEIVRVSTHTEVGDKTIFWRNSPSQFLMYTSRLILLYTDIEFEMEASYKAYDSLNESGALSVLLSVIPDSERSEFSTILEMVNDDTENNERSFAGYMDTKIDAIGLGLNTILSAINEATEKNGGTEVSNVD